MSDPVDLLLERVCAAAQERRLSAHTLTAYRRTWLKIFAWAAAEGMALEGLPRINAGTFYEEATRNRSASHHLQVKAALAFLFRVLGVPDPFSECLAPKPNPPLPRFHTPSQLARLITALYDDRGSYYGCLTYHLAKALFFTGCRFHEWAKLPLEGLVREPDRGFASASIGLGNGGFRILRLPAHVAESLAEWVTFLESVKGMRLRGGGVAFASSPLVFPGRDGGPFSNQAFNARIKLACLRADVPVISAQPLRTTAASVLLGTPGTTLRDVKALLGHKSIATTARYNSLGQEGAARREASVHS